ncbi:MAG: nuclear transport factor 2 family protein [Candidatus Eremiobacteraeota bacterium]|nr:nuclear transport factor 2 family protein [Candidatus Eremiobacteraeota bacterium]
MNREETRKAFKDYFKDYDTGDYRMALNKHYTEDAVFENTRVQVIGRDNIIEWFTRSHALGYTEKLVSENMLIGEDNVAVELEQEFTALKDVPNQYVSPLKKGETIKTSGVAAFYKMRDGKICSVRVYCTMNDYNPMVFKDKHSDKGVNS